MNEIISYDACSHCSWPILESDRFCGWCKAELVDLKLIACGKIPLEDAPFRKEVYSDELDPIPLVILNRSKFPMHVHGPVSEIIRCEPEMFSVMPCSQSPGMSIYIHFNPDIERNKWFLREIPLKFQIVDQSKVNLGSIVILDSPTIRPKPDKIRLDIISGETSQAGTVDLSLYYTDIKVSDIQISEPFIKCHGFTGLWKQETNRILELSFDLSAVTDDVSEIAFHIRVFVENKNRPIEIPMRLMLSRKPKPKIKIHQLEHNVAPGDFYNIEMEPENLGGMDYQIKDLKFVARKESSQGIEITLNHVFVDEKRTFPFVIRPGEKEQLPFRVELDTTALEPDTSYNIFLICTTDVENQTQHPEKFYLKVNPVRLFEGAVAVDFGNTNSTCAIYDPREHDPQLVQLDRKKQLSDSGKVVPIPSLIYFEDFDKHLIGFDAENKAQDSVLGTRVLRGMKQLLGSNRKHYPVVIDVRSQEYNSRDITQFFCEEIRRIVESAVGKWRGRVVFTFPTTFRLYQSQDIQAIAKKMGFTAVSFLDEARAVAYYAVNQQNLQLEENDYFLIFDHGGGTTDLAICQKKGSSLKVIDVAGDDRFGGDDITDLIVRNCIIRQIELLTRPGVIYSRTGLDLHGMSKPTFDARRKLVENTHFLWKAAEEIKHKWDEYKENPSFNKVPPVWILDDGHFLNSADLKSDLNEITLEIQSIEQMVTTILSRIIDNVKAILIERNITLDKIILAGQGAKFPLIPKILGDSFEAELITLNELKGAVALGAAYFARDNRKTMDDQAIARFAYGLEITELERQFKELIPKNTPLPTRTKGMLTPFRDATRSFHVIERWGVAMPYDAGKNPNFRRYTQCSYTIPPHLQQALEKESCVTVLRILSDETLSLCLLFPVSDLEGFIGYINDHQIQTGEIRNSYFDQKLNLRTPEAFHEEILEFLDRTVCYIVELSPKPFLE